ncbi:hypothetical protein P171DRAFT_441870 [Karstenula rhodostoma CBS 690.94]|uniref:DUF7702 domain-containing protein n=1 Tax=Karstenula rhodostoma CBS 690.94 TaxID=1392251 RepID=A0A9P4PMT1_9PLEO|nr:hypothetical protein P171DRAFT_441870 [Karstenula rhodostoma CBS 690.94]
MEPHTAVGIATVIFYAPVTLYAQYIGFRCWKYGSRMACYMVMIFTLIRLAGGALIISVEKGLSEDNADMIKAAYVLINLGVVPLLAAYDGFLSLISRDNFPKARILRFIHHVCAVLIMLSTGLLIGAATMTGEVDQASLQSALYKIGYFIFLAVLLIAVLLSLRVALLQHDRVKQSHLTIVKWLLLASPFLALRTAYGIIGIFDVTGANMFTSMWSSLFGSAAAFALMALLPEYIIVCIYMRILNLRVRTCREMNQLLDEGRDADEHEMEGRQKH